MEYEQHFERRHNYNKREHPIPYEQAVVVQQDEDVHQRILLQNYTNNNLGMMDHPNISTESCKDNAPISITGQIMNNIDVKSNPTTRRIEVTKSMPIPIQRTDRNRNNRRGGIDNYFNDSSDDDNYNVQSPIVLGHDSKQQQYSTPLDYSVTSVSSSSSSNILFHESSHRPVAKSLPSRTALLRAPYLGSRKPSQAGLLDDDDEYDNTDDGQDFYFDRPVSSNARKILVLPPSQQFLDSNTMNNSDKASYLMTGSLLNHSSSAVPAYGSLRESHLDGRFVSKSFFPSANGRSKNEYNDFHDNSVPSATLAASAPGQLSIGERMHQSRLRRQQQHQTQSANHGLGQVLGGTNENAAENTYPTAEQTSSGRIKTRSLLGEMCYEGTIPNIAEVEEGTNVKVSPGSTTPQIVNSSKSNELGQFLVSSSPLALDITKDQDNTSKFQCVPYIEQVVSEKNSNRDDISALTYSMKATKLDENKVKGTFYNDEKTAEAEEATLSKSLTAFDILRQLSGQQQRKQVNFQTVASSYIPTTSTNPRSNTIGMSSAMYGPLVSPSTSATNFSTGSSMQYQHSNNNFKQQYSNNVTENDLIYSQQYVQDHPSYEDNVDTMGAFDLDM